MKQYLVIIVTITLITNAQCGLIDAVFGVVKNTTKTITQDVHSVVKYGKSIVFGDNKLANKSDRDVTERSLANEGIIDRISLKIHDVAAGFREHVRTAIAMFDKDKNGTGPIGRMLERIQNKVTKVKGYFVHDKAQNVTQDDGVIRPSRNITFLQEKLKEYVLKNTTMSSGIRKTLHGLLEAAEKLRNNITKGKKDEGFDGTGLIDVRLAQGDLAGDIAGVNEAVGKGIPSVDDETINIISRNQEKARNSIDDSKRSSNNLIGELRDEYNKIDGNVINDVNKTFTNAYSAVNYNGTVD